MIKPNLLKGMSLGEATFKKIKAKAAKFITKTKSVISLYALTLSSGNKNMYCSCINYG